MVVGSSGVRLLGATVEVGVVLVIRVVVCGVDVDLLRVATTVCSVFAKVHLYR